MSDKPKRRSGKKRGAPVKSFAKPRRKSAKDSATAKNPATDEDEDDWEIRNLLIGIERWDYASSIWSYEDDATYQKTAIDIQGHFLESCDFAGSAVKISITPSDSSGDKFLETKYGFNTFGEISLSDDATDEMSININLPKEYWTEFVVILASGHLKILALEAVWNPKGPYIIRFSAYTKYLDPL